MKSFTKLEHRHFGWSVPHWPNISQKTHFKCSKGHKLQTHSEEVQFSDTDLLQFRVCTPVSQSGHKANSVSRCFSNPQMSAGGTFYRAWNFCGILDISMGVYGEIFGRYKYCMCLHWSVGFIFQLSTYTKKKNTKLKSVILTHNIPQYFLMFFDSYTMSKCEDSY